MARHKIRAFLQKKEGRGVKTLVSIKRFATDLPGETETRLVNAGRGAPSRKSDV